MLKSVRKPDGSIVSFEYDALGRRTSKTFGENIKRFLWDGNILLHEWDYDKKDKSRAYLNDLGELIKDEIEPINNLVTWIYDNNSYNPSAKILENETYSIVNDYLGTPIQAYNESGTLVWERELDIYGKIRKIDGDKNLIPFRFQGQYYDVETDLCYSRFRYYDPNIGNFISQDPIGLLGNNPNLYAYVKDSNTWIDVFGLDAIPNKVAGDAREAIAKTWLQNKFPNAEILSERYIRDINGKSVKDINNSRRRLDFVVVEDGKVKGVFEVTRSPNI
jgi:RHS repeat-associated protein